MGEMFAVAAASTIGGKAVSSGTIILTFPDTKATESIVARFARKRR
jgi:hypothetical protein